MTISNDGKDVEQQNLSCRWDKKFIQKLWETNWQLVLKLSIHISSCMFLFLGTYLEKAYICLFTKRHVKNVHSSIIHINPNYSN